MITDKDRKKLKHIPYRNAKIIQSILLERGKHVYSSKTIANVFRGHHENLDIEESFYILNSKIALRKKQIKKPEALTPGSN
jgi:hypothetical protein